jgi:hypothetical protein
VPASPTPLVMVFESQTKTISLIFQGQRGTQISLMPNSGHCRTDRAAGWGRCNIHIGYRMGGVERLVAEIGAILPDM